MSDKDATFDFAAAGYESPADWARLCDLIPDKGQMTAGERQTWKRWEDGGEKKGTLLSLLKNHGIGAPPFDAEAAGRRNA